MSDPNKNQFIADMAEFVQDGVWQEFLAFMQDKGVPPDVTENWIGEITDGDLN